MGRHHADVKLCCEFGCEQRRWCYGRCKVHFAALDPTLYEHLKLMTRAERKIEFEGVTSQPDNPSVWEYTVPDSAVDELAAKYGGNIEDGTQEKIDD